MRHLLSAVLFCSIVACGGDSAPLPPLANGPAWLPLMLDTTGNMVLRRMATWVDTAHVTTNPEGHAVAAQKMQMDMKIGGMSTTMQMRTEFDCAGQRYRVTGVDSMTATMKGVPMPDSVARTALSQQSGNMTDTTWRTASSDGASGRMVAAVCQKAGSQAAAAPAAQAPKK
jgi:hypothetical protein